MREAVLVTGVRTPVGRYLGSVKEIPAYELGAIVLKEVVERAALDPSRIDEVIMGQSYQSGESVNVARMALLKAGFPDSIPGITVDRRCCTGLDVVCLAAMKIQSGYADIVVAGGVESMSNAEFYLPGSIKWGVGGVHGMPRGHGDLSTWGLPLYPHPTGQGHVSASGALWNFTFDDVMGRNRRASRGHFAGGL